MDWDRVDRAECAVDAADQLVELLAKRPVRGDVAARRDGHLNEPHPVSVLRFAFEQTFEGQQAPGDALGVVETIDPEQDLASPRLGADSSGTGADVGTRRELLELADVD